MVSFIEQYKFRPIKDGLGGELKLPIGVEEELWSVNANGQIQVVPWSYFGEHEEIVLYQGREGSADKIIPELPAQQVECVTAIAANVDELKLSLERFDKRLLDLACKCRCFFHRDPMPPHRLTRRDLEVFPRKRYEQIFKKLGPSVMKHAWIAGLHIHLGVSSWAEALRLYNGMISYLPLLLAISIRDKRRFLSYQSLMKMLSGQFLPPYIGSFEQLEMFAEEQGFLTDPSSCWWLMRFNPQGTIELRLFDVQEDMQATVELAAVVRALGAHILKSGTLVISSPEAIMKRLLQAVENPERFTPGIEKLLQALACSAHYDGGMLPERDNIISLMKRKEYRLGRVSKLVA